MENVNVDMIKEIAQGSSTAKEVFKYLSTRRRNRAETNLARAVRMIKERRPSIQADKIEHVFKNLADAGAGHLVVGKTPDDLKFVWDVNLKEIGGVMLTQLAEVKPFPAPTPRPAEPVLPAAMSPGRLFLKLNNGMEVGISTPILDTELAALAGLLDKLKLVG